MTLSTPASLLLLFLLSLGSPDWRPRIQDFIPQGQTYRTLENCLRLTEDKPYSAGSIWYKHSVNLRKPFSFKLMIKAGCNDAGGADGMVFVMSPYRSQTGYVGEGQGFAGLVPSMGIEIDTWQNNHLYDPVEDHLALMFHGRVGHYYKITEPYKIKNIEDCKRHSFGVSWDPVAKWLSVKIDSKEIISRNIDLIQDVFQGKSQVYWGMTAATGRASNVHEVCFEWGDRKLPPEIEKLVR